MRVQTRHVHTRCVQKLIEHILTTPEGPVRVPDLAVVAGLSRFHLSRIFQAQTGESLADFARRIRLERSAHRLRHTRESVSRIAAEAGYANGESFSRAFRQFFRCSPSEYRDDTRDDWRLETVSDLHWEPGCDPILFAPRQAPDIVLVSLRKIRLAAYRHVGSWRNLGRPWAMVRNVVERAYPSLTRPRLFTIHYDNVQFVPVDQIRIDLAVQLPPGEALPLGWHSVVIPAGTYATTPGFEPSTRYRDIWQRMEHDWIPSCGQRPAVVPTFEEYPEWPMPWEQARLRAFVGLDMGMVVPP